MGLLNDVGGGIISAVGNILGQRAQNRHNLQTQREQNTANMELSKYQFDRQKEMYNEANLYNSPASQMERFKTAGLNPNLIYGQGSSGNAPNQLPQYRAPEFQAYKHQAINPSQIIDSYISTKSQLQQLKNLQAQGRILDAQALEKESGIPFFGRNQANKSALLYNQVQPSMLKSILAGAEKNSLFQYKGGAGSVENWEIKPELSSMWSSYLYGKYMKPETMLNQYNANIALTNARKQYQDLEIENYIPKWLNTAIGSGSSLLGKMFNGLRGSKPYPKLSTYRKY